MGNNENTMREIFGRRMNDLTMDQVIALHSKFHTVEVDEDGCIMRGHASMKGVQFVFVYDPTNGHITPYIKTPFGNMRVDREADGSLRFISESKVLGFDTAVKLDANTGTLSSIATNSETGEASYVEFDERMMPLNVTELSLNTNRE